MRFVKDKLNCLDLRQRLAYSACLFLLLFLVVTAVSYFVLPQGLLKNKNPMQTWEGSSDIATLALQIFMYNMVSVCVIVVASSFGKKRESETHYTSVGYLVFGVLVCINGIVLGTWSFSATDAGTNAGIAPSLLKRVIGIFDVLHKAALWEMLGQLLITCSLAKAAIVQTNNKTTLTRHIRDVRISVSERSVFIGGICMMLCGAIIEGIAIAR